MPNPDRVVWEISLSDYVQDANGEWVRRSLNTHRKHSAPEEPISPEHWSNRMKRMRAEFDYAVQNSFVTKNEMATGVRRLLKAF